MYGHADHNLTPSLVTDMAEMARARLDDRTTVIVMADWDATRTRKGGGNFPSGTEWYRVVGGGMEAERLGDVEPEQNLDDPAVLRASIRRALEEHPADRYGLVLWDHGGGWDGGFGGEHQNGTVEHPEALRISQVRDAVRGALDDVGLDRDRPLAFLAFDTCLLGAAEVSHALADLSEIYIANAEIDYGDGWDYEAMLTHIAANRDVDARELGAHEARVWDAHHRSAGASDRLLRSHIVLDTARIAAVDEAIGSLADALLAADRWLDLAIVTSRSMPPYGGGVDRAHREVQYRDIGLVARRLSRNEDATIAGAAERVLRALADARVGGSQGTMRESTDQLGLSIALPLPLDITTERLASYRDRAAGFARTRWDDVLQELGAAADEVAPAPVLTATDAGDGVDVSVRVDDEDIVRIEVHVAVDDPDRPDNDIRYGVIGAAVAEPGVTYALRWDRAVATLDGTNPVPLEQWVDGGARRTRTRCRRSCRWVGTSSRRARIRCPVSS
ncbi:MAG: hypothetical protein OHK0013_15760 [Sandaracinaceae bacterium]